MTILENMLNNLPQQFRGKQNIEVFLAAVAAELELLKEAEEEMMEKISLENATGKSLDGIGDIVVLSREEAGKLMQGEGAALSDDLYRLLLRYKALKNVSLCTYPEIVNMCQMLYQSDSIKYREDARFPAHFDIMIGTDIPLDVIELMANAKLTIKPAGVSVTMAFHPEDFFGFSDINPRAKGFGVGKFAQQMI